MVRLSYILIFPIFVCACSGRKEAVELVFKWNFADYFDPQLPSARSSEAAANNYIPGNNIIYGIAHDVINNVLYASIPRSGPGVPVTLAVLENVTDVQQVNPKFDAFPNYLANELKACDTSPGRTKRRKNNARISSTKLDYSFDDRFDVIQLKKSRFPHCDTQDRIISTYQPVLDKCGRLWILDTGVLEYNTGDIVVKRPQLWAFDVKFGPRQTQVIRRYDFPQQVIIEGIGLSGLTVDIVGNSCEKTFVYIPNQIDDRIVVYDFYKDESWFLENYSFSGDNTESDFIHEGHPSRFIAGVSTITLGPVTDRQNDYRIVYYTAGGSTGQYSISSRDLRHPRPDHTLSRPPTLVGHRGGDSQAMVHVYDNRNGVLFFAENQSGRVRCWNSEKPLRPDNLVTIFQSKNFVYGSHISIDLAGDLWFMSNSYPIFKAGLYDKNKFNIRLYRGNVAELIAGTACESPRREIELTKENIKKYFNITVTEVINL